MIRWRTCLVLTLLLLIPLVSGKEDKDDDDDDRNDDNNEDDEEEDEEEDEDDPNDDEKKSAHGGGGRRAPPVLASPKSLLTVSGHQQQSKTVEAVKKAALECYVCAYKAETPLRACLDPTKFRVHTITCHSSEDKCFTSVISHGSSYDAVIRGCRSNCIGTPDNTCCEMSRCNSQAFAMPVVSHRVLAPVSNTKVVTKSLSSKPVQPSVLFFVSILLILQTVVKVNIVI